MRVYATHLFRATPSQHFAFVSIGVDYFQILAMFGNANVPWPAAILTLFRIMSSFSFNLDITAPECSMPNLSYPTKWCVLWGLGPAVCVHTARSPSPESLTI